jgi:glucose-1-phosphate cytidylyltransferase
VDAPLIPVVILCGGKGTRLREETEYKPKPMVEIGGRPILWHIMRGFANHGFRHFILCLGYRGEMIKEYFLHFRAMESDFTVTLGADTNIDYHAGSADLDGCRVTLVDTGAETMTGGRVARAARYVSEDRFIVTYGDAVSDVDLAALYAFHEQEGRTATATVVSPISRFGVVDLDGGSIQAFHEKPRLEGWVSAGYFVFDRPIFDRLPGGDQCVLEEEPLRSLAAVGELAAFRHKGFWQPMDTYREYELLNELWQSGNAPWTPTAGLLTADGV